MSFPTFGKYANFKIPAFSFVEKYLTFVLTPPAGINKKFITELRECIYDIILNNIEMNVIYNYVLEKLSENHNLHIYRIINIIATSERQLKAGNKEPIHLEALVFNLIKEIHFGQL